MFRIPSAIERARTAMTARRGVPPGVERIWGLAEPARAPMFGILPVCRERDGVGVALEHGDLSAEKRTGRSVSSAAALAVEAR